MNDQTPLRRRLSDVLRESENEPELSAERGRKWKAENAQAIASYNDWFREHGLLLGPFRKS